MPHPKFDSEVLSQLLKRPGTHGYLAKNLANEDHEFIKKHVTEDHIKDLVDGIKFSARDSSHTRAIPLIVEKKYGDKQKRTSEIDNVPSHIIDHMLGSTEQVNNDTRRSYLRQLTCEFRSSLTPKHINMLLSSDDEDDRFNGIKATRVSNEQLLHHANNDVHTGVRYLAKRILNSRINT